VAFSKVPYAEVKVRNEWKKQNIIAISKFFCSFLTAMTLALQTPFEKITVTSDGSNNSGVSGQSPQPPEAYGGLAAEPPTLRRFSSFFKKIKHFYAFYGLNFCLETCFKMTAKCVVDASSFLKACVENTVHLFQKKNALWSNILLKNIF